jgi:hypothetical protein
MMNITKPTLYSYVRGKDQSNKVGVSTEQGRGESSLKAKTGKQKAKRE